VSWLQAAAMLPFVLVVPGYAITAALFPRRTIERSDRVVYAFVFSIGASALGGLVLQVVLGLGTGAWLGLLLAITVGSALVARRRRAKVPIQSASVPSMLPPAGAIWVLGFVIAAAIAGAAIAIAANGVHEQQSQQVFASLWAVPANGAQPAKGLVAPLEVGVWNHGGPAAYRLHVSSGDRTIVDLPVRMGEGERWRRTLPPSVTTGTGSLLIVLLRRHKPYRELELNIGEAR
jgi:hypothetical protein